MGEQNKNAQSTVIMIERYNHLNKALDEYVSDVNKYTKAHGSFLELASNAKQSLKKLIDSIEDALAASEDSLSELELDLDAFEQEHSRLEEELERVQAEKDAYQADLDRILEAVNAISFGKMSRKKRKKLEQQQQMIADAVSMDQLRAINVSVLNQAPFLEVRKAINQVEDKMALRSSQVVSMLDKKETEFTTDIADIEKNANDLTEENIESNIRDLQDFRDEVEHVISDFDMRKLRYNNTIPADIREGMDYVLELDYSLLDYYNVDAIEEFLGASFEERPDKKKVVNLVNKAMDPIDFKDRPDGSTSSSDSWQKDILVDLEDIKKHIGTADKFDALKEDILAFKFTTIKFKQYVKNHWWNTPYGEAEHLSGRDWRPQGDER